MMVMFIVVIIVMVMMAVCYIRLGMGVDSSGDIVLVGGGVVMGYLWISSKDFSRGVDDC